DPPTRSTPVRKDPAYIYGPGPTFVRTKTTHDRVIDRLDTIPEAVSRRGSRRLCRCRRSRARRDDADDADAARYTEGRRASSRRALPTRSRTRCWRATDTTERSS